MALVELYTARNCSGCVLAEQRLAELARRYSAEHVFPVTLRLESWTYLPVGEAPASQRLWARERRLSLRQRMALVYAPQVLVQGQDFPAWRSDSLEHAVERINARPPRARLALEMASASPAGLRVAVQGEIDDPSQRDAAVLYVGAFQRQARETVALQWQGPIAPRAGGRFAEALELALLPSATVETSGAAAFVQNRHTGEVLQVVRLGACSR